MAMEMKCMQSRNRMQHITPSLLDLEFSNWNSKWITPRRIFHDSKFESRQRQLQGVYIENRKIKSRSKIFNCRKKSNCVENFSRGDLNEFFQQKILGGVSHATEGNSLGSIPSSRIEPAIFFEGMFRAHGNDGIISRQIQ